MSVERFFGDVFETEEIEVMLDKYITTKYKGKVDLLSNFIYFTEAQLISEMIYTDDERCDKYINVKEKDVFVCIDLNSAWCEEQQIDYERICIWYRPTHPKNLFKVIEDILDKEYKMQCYYYFGFEEKTTIIKY